MTIENITPANTVAVEIVPANANTSFLRTRGSYEGRSYTRECCRKINCEKVSAAGLCLLAVASVVGLWAGGNAYSACKENCDGLEVITIISGIVVGGLFCAAICIGSESSGPRGQPCGHIS